MYRVKMSTDLTALYLSTAIRYSAGKHQKPWRLILSNVISHALVHNYITFIVIIVTAQILLPSSSSPLSRGYRRCQNVCVCVCLITSSPQTILYWFSQLQLLLATTTGRPWLRQVALHEWTLHSVGIDNSRDVEQTGVIVRCRMGGGGVTLMPPDFQTQPQSVARGRFRERERGGGGGGG